jgi:hypothetical protein
MRSTTKIWLGVGAFVVVGAGGALQGPSAARALMETTALSGAQSDPAPQHASSRVAQRKQGGGERGHGERRHGGEKGGTAKQGGEGGEGEGGEGGRGAQLAPEPDFALRIAQMRGHLLVGDELVKESQWNAAYPHFRHPTEELYGGIRARLKEYNVPPFEAALRVLANVVKAKKDGDEYAKARRAVMDAFAAADVGLKAKRPDWAGFTVETALETLKSAVGEYEEAVANGRIRKPVEYQDARGFILQAEVMIESVASMLERKDAAALASARAALADLKKAFPTVMPPEVPVKDYGAVLADVSRVELALGKMM